MAVADTPPTNQLLRLLDPSEYQRLASALKPTTLRAREVLYKPNEPMRNVYLMDMCVTAEIAQLPHIDTPPQAESQGLASALGHIDLSLQGEGLDTTP